MDKEKKCVLPTEVYSRVVGYFRPVQNWNAGKKEEFQDRKPYLPSFFDQPVTQPWLGTQPSLGSVKSGN